MDDLPIVTRRCRAIVNDALGVLRSQPPTAASRAHQIQALAILRTLDDWLTRAPFPEQPPRLARMTHDLAASVFGEDHPRTLELRTNAGPPDDGAVAGTPPGALRVCVSCRRGEPAAGAVCTECGGPLDVADAASVVDGRYVLLRELGRGGMGVVHEAIDLLLERPAAVKLLAGDGDLASALAVGLRKEATALAAVRNEHVVQVYAFGVHGRSYYLAMERVLGRDLASILDQHEEDGSALPVPLAVAILGRIASGVTAVHEAGLLHRDLKPSNILIEERTGRAVLVDFGLALRRPPGGAALGNEAATGTPLYLAPEHVAGGDSAASQLPGRWNASDIYALGCTAFEMLTGRAPFLGPGIEAALQLRRTGPPPRASSVRPSMVAFDAPLLRALATDPRERYATADELARDLERALQIWQNPAPTQPAMPGVSSPPPRLDAEVAAVSLTEGARVLIVDDDPVFLMLATRCISLAFSQAPVRIDVVASSAAAIAAARRTMPDLVILDYCMPREDGVGALTRLRGLPGGDRPRVVVVSATVPSIGKWHFEALGVKDFVAKPVRPQAFIALVADIAARAGWQSSRMNAPRQAAARTSSV
jgi:serine/threonine-protein kinase